MPPVRSYPAIGRLLGLCSAHDLGDRRRQDGAPAHRPAGDDPAWPAAGLLPGGAAGGGRHHRRCRRDRAYGPRSSRLALGLDRQRRFARPRSALGGRAGDWTASVRILVAVADVDALVTRGLGASTAHARANTTSVYTAAQIFPMLPEKLSTDLTSLSEAQERLAVVIDMAVGPRRDREAAPRSTAPGPQQAPSWPTTPSPPGWTARHPRRRGWRRCRGWSSSSAPRTGWRRP